MWQRLGCMRLLEAVRAAVVGAKDKAIMRPKDGGIVDLEPGHSEDHGMVTEAHDIELDVFGVRSDLELDRSGVVSDGDGSSIGEHQVSRLGLETERDRMGLSKGDIDEGTGCARVDHRLCGDRRALRSDIDRENKMFFLVFLVFAGERQKVSGRDESRSTLARARWGAQRSALYCDWAGPFPHAFTAVMADACPGRERGMFGRFGRTGQSRTAWLGSAQYMQRFPSRRRCFSSSESGPWTVRGALRGCGGAGR